MSCYFVCGRWKCTHFQPITKKAGLSLRTRGKMGYTVLKTPDFCRIKENFPWTQPWHWPSPSWRAHAGQPELKPHQNDMVFYLPFCFLLHLFFRSFFSSLLPTFLKLLTCQFLKKEKRVHFPLSVPSDSPPLEAIIYMKAKGMECWNTRGLSGKPVSGSVKRHIYIFFLWHQFKFATILRLSPCFLWGWMLMLLLNTVTPLVPHQNRY